MQQSFSKSSVFSGLLIAGLVVGTQSLLSRMPDREARPDSQAAVVYEPVELTAGTGELQPASAWQIRSREARFGGLSALGIDGDRLVALNDSGVVIGLPKPGVSPAMASFRDLPDGPGDPGRKSRRDSEALARLSDGDWLVAFENRNRIWRYDPAFRHGRQVVSFMRQGWATNRGIEAMAVDSGGGLVAIPEGYGTLVAITAVVETRPLASLGWTVSDAARLPDGRLFVLLRRVTATGFRNAIGELVHDRAGWRIMERGGLPLGMFDNAEGLTAERLAGGGTRLWIVTDNDFTAYRRTLLIAVDLPAAGPKARHDAIRPR